MMAWNWIGSLIGLVGYLLLCSKTAASRRAGAWISFASCLILIPWALVQGIYGLALLWSVISVISVYGAWNNRGA